MAFPLPLALRALEALLNVSETGSFDPTKAEQRKSAIAELRSYLETSGDEKPQAWNEFLSAEERRELTGLATASRQACWLRGEGIHHRQVKNRVIVSRTHVREWLEGRAPAKKSGINWTVLTESEKRMERSLPPGSSKQRAGRD